MKCSTKSDFFYVSRLVVYSAQFDLHLSEVSLSTSLLKHCDKRDESSDSVRVSLTAIAELLLPQITEELLNAAGEVDLFIEKNRGFFYSVIQCEWFFSNLRELNILKNQDLNQFVLNLAVRFFLKSIYIKNYRFATIYIFNEDLRACDYSFIDFIAKEKNRESTKKSFGFLEKIVKIFVFIPKILQIIYFNTKNRISPSDLSDVRSVFQVYGGPNDVSDLNVDLLKKYWCGTSDWTDVSESNVCSKTFVMPISLLDLPSADLLNDFENSEASRGYIHFWRNLDIWTAFLCFFFIFSASFKSIIFWKFLKKKIIDPDIRSSTQGFLTHLARNYFAYFKCCVTNSVFRAVFGRIVILCPNLQSVFLTYECQPWEKIMCDSILDRNKKCNIYFYQHAYQRVFDFRFSGDSLNLALRAPYGLNSVRFNLISRTLLDRFERGSINSNLVKASRYVGTNWSLHERDDGPVILIGSDNLLFDELALNLVTSNTGTAVFYLPHPLHRESVDARVFPNLISKEQIRKDGFSWLFCSPYTSLPVELLCSDTTRFSIVNVLDHDDLHRFWPLTRERLELADLVW